MTADLTRSGSGVGLAARRPVSGTIGSSKKYDTHIITLGENGFEQGLSGNQALASSDGTMDPFPVAT